MKDTGLNFLCANRRCKAKIAKPLYCGACEFIYIGLCRRLGRLEINPIAFSIAYGDTLFHKLETIGELFVFLKPRLGIYQLCNLADIKIHTPKLGYYNGADTIHVSAIVRFSEIAAQHYPEYLVPLRVHPVSPPSFPLEEAEGLNSEQAARYIGVSQYVTLELARAGKLACHVRRPKYVFTQACLEDFVRRVIADEIAVSLDTRKKIIAAERARREKK